MLEDTGEPMTNVDAAEALEAMPVAYALYLDEVKAIEVASTVLRRDQWEPIESAPEDGTPVLIAYATRDGVRVTLGQFDQLNGGQWRCDIGFVPPTHWMPLPSPPTEG